MILTHYQTLLNEGFILFSCAFCTLSQKYKTYYKPFMLTIKTDIYSWLYEGEFLFPFIKFMQV